MKGSRDILRSDPDERRRRRRGAIGPDARWLWVTVAAAVVFIAGWAAVATLATPSNQCDNIAGTCLRVRQRAAIASIDVAAVLAVTAAAFVAIQAFRRRRVSAAALATLALVSSFAVALLLVDPVERLNDRWQGWLATGPAPCDALGGAFVNGSSESSRSAFANGKASPPPHPPISIGGGPPV